MRFRQHLLRTLLAVACAVTLPVTAAFAAGTIQVTVDNLNVRSGPSTQDQVVTTLPIKTVLPVISEKGDWIHVRLPNGKTGWVANWLVTKSGTSTKPAPQSGAQSTAPQVESTTDNVNVRSGPGQNYSVVQKINPGKKYTVTQRSGEWVQIQLSASAKGWVAGWLVTEHNAGKPAGQPSTTPAGGNPPAAPAHSDGSAGAGQAGSQGSSLTLEYNPYIYPSPDFSLPAIGQLHSGYTITVTKKQNGWIQFPYDGIQAWIPEEGTTQPGTGQANAGSGAANQNQQPPDVQPPANNGSTNTQQPAKQTATVQTDGLNLRAESSTASAVLGTLKAGSTLTVLEKKEDWYRVQTPDGKIGWVAGWLVTVQQPVMPAPPGPHVTVLNPDTNVRSGPGTNHPILKQIQPGEKYSIIKREGDWFELKFTDGSTGFVAGWLVSATGTPAVVKTNALVGKVIVVDPGHGGNDNGATGSSFSTLEKTVNLQVALLLRNKLEAAGAKVIMTRSDDRKLTLQQRVDVAIQNNADIFVSIHHNTHPNSTTNGTIIFHYNKGNSSKLASLVQAEVVKATSYKDLQSRFGNYYVLRENPVTSILAEIGFLSNYNEELRLRSEKQQDLAAEGLFNGILQYFSSQSVQEG
ncbi:SH3 domain-containing protein [Brevibacillus borstelensis]|uniref:SH3 domain-containing protein n=1 Tax=Brevibacillus borstelensis TaxID=45462 RepID=UPI00046851CB|nr:SH3 domain-containing protein [Brevibacillus borstelensis]MCM3473103.1 SH3 domain-containing protein [Brevibacillus borstelensis]MED1852228.1 SH3 domain-containing protein [Brevibacillus borstelensis]